MRAEKLTVEDESKELLGDIDFKDTSTSLFLRTS